MIGMSEVSVIPIFGWISIVVGVGITFGGVGLMIFGVVMIVVGALW